MKEPKKKTRSSTVSVARDLAETDNIGFAITEVRHSSQLEALRIDNQIKIFASMCPDEILDYYDSYDTRSYHTTLMLGDVSGFTDLTEKYTKSGKGGPSRLTETLNSYIGAMVQEILSHHGDVLKFSGDAFIVMWKLKEGRIMRDIATEAIKTACIIQKHFGTYETEVDVTLKVKLAIASGKTYFTSIGDPETTSHYIITGKPVWEVKHAEGLCRGGDILVASSCWQWVNPNEYIYEILPDGIHTLIISLSVLWDNAKESYDDNIVESSITSNSDIDSRITYESSYSSDKSLAPLIFYRDFAFSEKSEDTKDYSLRPKVIKAVKEKLNNELRRYMLRPVIRSVEMDEPLEYLTEIRQVVIVFVNVITEDTNRKTLIKLVNAAFLLVCSVVGEMQGCVNKTSLFDKDLIFLCIFGLRGDKHELESQIGLRCASKLRRGLVQIQKIKSVSVGVTTGMTYCGVVGHVLRREYTVIGMAVNKAARLMCAYKDKVICDRESFLLSHLEAKHFVLQEVKSLKGISNVGPIYAFCEQDLSTTQELIVNKYPLLGRDTELRIFHELLLKMINSSNDKETDVIDKSVNNILIIRGEPRIGKTRLLEEMTHMTPIDVPVNFISLAPYDNQIPYVLLRLIFYIPLEMTEDATLKEKQKKLSERLDDSDQWRLCALNHAFNVNFKISSDYAKLEHNTRRKHLKKLLKKLSQRSFEDLWLVIIDDAELADDESMSLLYALAHQKKVLLVLGYGNKLSRNYFIPPKIAKGAQIIDLMGLDKWYHAALACQVMNVAAIPAELEKVIQERSSGNPGWIESFLISLLQTKGVVLENLTIREINSRGLVTPPIYLLKRFQGKLRLQIASNFVNKGWEMYESSFRESLEADDIRATQNNIMDYSCCTLTADFILEDIDTETTVDTILLKLYDSLTPLDQFLLKCAAVLGEMVDRKILEKLMEGTPPRDIGLSLVKLFELRIIGCAVGDFSRSPGPAVLFKRIHDLNLNIQIRCGCKGIEIPDELVFKENSVFTFLNSSLKGRILLAKYKKSKVLDLAMLKDLVIWGIIEQDPLNYKINKKSFLKLRDEIVELFPTVEADLLFELISTDKEEKECIYTRGLLYNYYKLVRRDIREAGFLTQKSNKNDLCTDTSSRIECLSDLPYYASCGLMRFKLDKFRETTYRLLTENQKVEFHSKALRYLQHNTRRCASCGGGQFNRLLGESTLDESSKRKLAVSMTTELRSSLANESLNIQDLNLIGVRELLLIAILEFVEVCLSTLNIPQATKLLTEGDELIDAIYNSAEDELIVLPYLKGKIQTLRGRCFLESGLITEAMTCFEATMKIMRYRFPTNPILIRIKSFFLLKQQVLMLTCLRNLMVGVLEGDAAHYNDQFASCLAQMFIVYRFRAIPENSVFNATPTLLQLKGMQDHARLAAIWGLNVALESNKDFFVLCTSYANMMITAHNYQYKLIIPYLETDAINLCSKRQDSLELQELNAISELYTRIFFSRWLRGMTNRATEIGFVVTRLANAIRSTNLKLIILPRLIQLLLADCRYGEVVSMLQELEFISQNDVDQSARTWYCALGIDLLLESGISIVTLRECEEFYQQESSKIMNLRDSEAVRRFFICMWLWYIRIGDWEAATVWRNRKCEDAILNEYTVTAAITVLKKIEGLLICYVFKIDYKNNKDAAIILSKIKEKFKVIENLRKVVKIISPRYLLMKAHCHMARFRVKSGLELLRKSKKVAQEYGNKLIYNWANHCEKAWTGSLSPIQQEFWKEQCTMGNQVDWHEVDSQKHKILPYTLPIPKIRY